MARAEHGLGGYRRGCRCDVCVKANRDVARKYRENHREKYNKYQKAYKRMIRGSEKRTDDL